MNLIDLNNHVETKLLELEHLAKALHAMDPEHQNRETSAIVYTFTLHIERLRAGYEAFCQAQVAKDRNAATTEQAA